MSFQEGFPITYRWQCYDGISLAVLHLLNVSRLQAFHVRAYFFGATYAYVTH